LIQWAVHEDSYKPPNLNGIGRERSFSFRFWAEKHLFLEALKELKALRKKAPPHPAGPCS
jgi:hypothetical protein